MQLPRLRPALALLTGCATAVTLAVAAPAAGASASARGVAAPSDTVRTTGGTVRGRVTADRREFLGIPYAAPPTGRLRFAPPAPAARWTGVRDATAKPAACAQSVFATTEDCLTLNVHVPAAAGKRRLPVMVWFHGGGYTSGTAADYDPGPLLRSGDAVVVGVNYRLGPLGFLALPQLAAESRSGPRATRGTVGNAGILDQQAALRLVRANAARFGGDPRRVTIFGESAGGHSVCMHVISPQARGLFHRAVSQSGACTGGALGPRSRTDAYAASRSYAAGLGCTDPATALDCLRALPADRLVAGGGGETGGSWEPTVDRRVVPGTTEAVLRSGRYNRVPMIIGSNRDEGTLFVWLNYHLRLGRPVTQQEFEAFVRGSAGSAADRVLARYTAERYGSVDLAWAAVLTDRTFACPAVDTVDVATGWWRPPVYQYEFDDPDVPPIFEDPFMPLGSYHSAEIFSLFDTLSGFRPSRPLSPAQVQLSDEMVRYWTTFARTGDPNPRGTRAWPAARGSDPKVLSLRPGGASRPVRTVDDVHGCAFWDRVPRGTGTGTATNGPASSPADVPSARALEQLVRSGS